MKWIEDRTEFFRAPPTRARPCTRRLGADRDGTLLALRDRYPIDLGAYTGRWGRRC